MASKYFKQKYLIFYIIFYSGAEDEPAKEEEPTPEE